MALRQSETTAGTPWIAAFVATLVAMMTLQTASLGFAPLLPSIQHEFHMSFSQLGLFTGAYGILAIALSVPAGLLVKRLGEKPVLIGGLFVVAAGLCLLAFSSSFTGSLVGRLVWIGGYRFAFVSVLAALAITCPPSLRGRTMGILGALSSLASVVGGPFGSLLSSRFGWRGGILGFVVVALAGLLIFVVFYHGVRPGEHRGTQISSATSNSPASAFKLPRVWALALFSGLVGMPAFGATFFGPAAAKSNFHVDALSTSWMISLGYLLACLLNLFVGYLIDRFNRWVIMTALLACAVPAALLMTSHDWDVFRLSTALVIAISFTAVNQSYGLAGDVMRGKQVGNVMGIISLGAGFTGYIGPQLLGILRDRTGSFSTGWYMVAGIAALTCLILVPLGYTAAGTSQRLTTSVAGNAPIDRGEA